MNLSNIFRSSSAEISRKESKKKLTHSELFTQTLKSRNLLSAIENRTAFKTIFNKTEFFKFCNLKLEIETPEIFRLLFEEIYFLFQNSEMENSKNMFNFILLNTFFSFQDESLSKKYQPLFLENTLDQKFSQKLTGEIFKLLNEESHFFKIYNCEEKQGFHLKNYIKNLKNNTDSENDEKNKIKGIILNGKTGSGKMTTISAFCNSFDFQLEFLDCSRFSSLSDFLAKFGEAIVTNDVKINLEKSDKISAENKSVLSKKNKIENLDWEKIAKKIPCLLEKYTIPQKGDIFTYMKKQAEKKAEFYEKDSQISKVQIKEFTKINNLEQTGEKKETEKKDNLGTMKWGQGSFEFQRKCEEVRDKCGKESLKQWFSNLEKNSTRKKKIFVCRNFKSLFAEKIVNLNKENKSGNDFSEFLNKSKFPLIFINNKEDNCFFGNFLENLKIIKKKKIDENKLFIFLYTVLFFEINFKNLPRDWPVFSSNYDLSKIGIQNCNTLFDLKISSLTQYLSNSSKLIFPISIKICYILKLFKGNLNAFLSFANFNLTYFIDSTDIHTNCFDLSNLFLNELHFPNICLRNFPKTNSNLSFYKLNELNSENKGPNFLKRNLKLEIDLNKKIKFDTFLVNFTESFKVFEKMDIRELDHHNFDLKLLMISKLDFENEDSIFWDLIHFNLRYF